MTLRGIENPFQDDASNEYDANNVNIIHNIRLFDKDFYCWDEIELAKRDEATGKSSVDVPSDFVTSGYPDI